MTGMPRVFLVASHEVSCTNATFAFFARLTPTVEYPDYHMHPLFNAGCIQSNQIFVSLYSVSQPSV